jgi:hypothetical protein
MLLCEIKDLTVTEVNELRKQLVKNLRDFCKKTFDKPVDLSMKNEHLYVKHHDNGQIEFDIWVHSDYVYLDNFYLDDTLKAHGIGTKFVETLVASLPESMTIKVRDHSGVDEDKISMSDTFWSKMKARHDDRKWIIVK